MNKPAVNKNNSIEYARLHTDLTWKGIYRVGGIALLITGPLYICGAILSIIIGPAPSASAIYLEALAGHVTLSQINFGIFILTDFLLIPAVMALYLALKQVSRNSMLIAAALLFVYIFLDLAVTEMNSAALVTLAQQFTSSATDVQRSATLAAANFALATLPLATFFSYVISSAGYLIISIVMLKSTFNRPSAILGIILSIMGIAGGFYVVLPVLAILLGQCLIAFGIWSILVGSRLYQLGKPVVLEKTGIVTGP